MYSDSPCDENGDILEPEAMGMPAGMHMITEVIIEITESNAKTHMKMTHVGVPEGAKGAWNQAFDKMELGLKAISIINNNI